MKYKLDNITKHDGKDIAYIQLLDDTGNVIATKSLEYKNKKEFKKILKEKGLKIEADYEHKKTKMSEIERALKELEA